MNTLKRLLIALGLGSVFSVANASPVHWTLDTTQTGYSFVQLYGTFTYDADINVYSNVALIVAPYSTVFNINAGDQNGFNYGISNNTGIFYFKFDTPLTDAGGIVTGTESDDFNGGDHRFTVEAAVNAAAVPEPEESALLVTGLGLAWIARRRRSRRIIAR